MCLLVLYFQQLSDAPILLVAHRDEYLDRSSRGPQIQQGDPPVLCGLDARAGGTWLGVNSHGLTVAVTNRPKQEVAPLPRSRGLLCRELLTQRSASEAANLAERELATGNYDGANFLCVDADAGWFICGGDHVELIPLDAGLHLLANADPDDSQDARQERARVVLPKLQQVPTAEFLDQVTQAMAVPAQSQHGRSGIVLRSAERGTVSSTALALARDPGESVYRYAPGTPDSTAYEDYSDMLRQVMSPS